MNAHAGTMLLKGMRLFASRLVGGKGLFANGAGRLVDVQEISDQ